VLGVRRADCWQVLPTMDSNQAATGGATSDGSSLPHKPWCATAPPLSIEEYNHRKWQCTAEQLSGLVSSPSFKQWAGRQGRPPKRSAVSTVLSILAATAVLLVLALPLASVPESSHSYSSAWPAAMQSWQAAFHRGVGLLHGLQGSVSNWTHSSSARKREEARSTQTTQELCKDSIGRADAIEQENRALAHNLVLLQDSVKAANMESRMFLENATACGREVQGLKLRHEGMWREAQQARADMAAVEGQSRAEVARLSAAMAQLEEKLAEAERQAGKMECPATDSPEGSTGPWVLGVLGTVANVMLFVFLTLLCSEICAAPLMKLTRRQEAEIQQAKLRQEAFQSELEELQSQAGLAKEKLWGLEAELLQALARNEELSAEIPSLRESLKAAHLESVAAEESMKALLEDARVSQAMAEEARDSSEQRAEVLQEGAEGWWRENEALSAELTRLRSEQAASREHLQSASAKADELTQARMRDAVALEKAGLELSTARDEKDALRHQADLQAEELGATQVELEQLRSTLTATQREVVQAAASAGSLAEQLSAALQARQQLELKCGDLVVELSRASVEAKCLVEKWMADAELAAEDLKTWKGKADELTRELTALQDTAAQREEELCAKVAVLAEAQLAATSDNLLALQQKAVKQDADLSAALAAEEQAAAKEAALTEQLSAALSRCGSLEQQTSQMQAELTRATEHEAEAGERQTAALSRCAELERQGAELQAELVRVSIEEAEAGKRLSAALACCEELQQQCSQLQVDPSTATDQAAAGQGLVAAQAEAQELSTKGETLKMELPALRAAEQSAQLQLQGVRSELLAAEEARTQAEAALGQVDAVAASLQGEREGREAELSRMAEEVVMCRGQLDEEHSKLAMAQAAACKAAASAGEFAEQMMDLLAVCKRLQESLISAARSEEDLLLKLEELTSAQAMVSRVEELEDLNDDLEEELMDKESQVKQLSQSIADREKNIIALQLEVGQLTIKLQEQGEQLEAAKEESTRCHSELPQLEEQEEKYSTPNRAKGRSPEMKRWFLNVPSDSEDGEPSSPAARQPGLQATHNDDNLHAQVGGFGEPPALLGGGGPASEAAATALLQRLRRGGGPRPLLPCRSAGGSPGVHFNAGILGALADFYLEHSSRDGTSPGGAA